MEASLSPMDNRRLQGGSGRQVTVWVRAKSRPIGLRVVDKQQSVRDLAADPGWGTNVAVGRSAGAASLATEYQDPSR